MNRNILPTVGYYKKWIVIEKSTSLEKCNKIASGSILRVVLIFNPKVLVGFVLGPILFSLLYDS